MLERNGILSVRFKTNFCPNLLKKGAHFPYLLMDVEKGLAIQRQGRFDLGGDVAEERRVQSGISGAKRNFDAIEHF